MSDMPHRIQLRRTKGWRKPPNTIVVARPGKWGNPWTVGDPGGFWLPSWPIANSRITAPMCAEDAVELYRRLLIVAPEPAARYLPRELNAEGRKRVRDDLRAFSARILRDLPALRGHNLACWCPLDAPCHADVLLRIANE